MPNESLAEKTILKKFGQQIRFYRKLKKWPQDELAHRAGLHRTYIGAIERGERNVSLINIEKLATALEISIAELFQEQTP